MRESYRTLCLKLWPPPSLALTGRLYADLGDSVNEESCLFLLHVYPSSKREIREAALPL